MTTVGTSRASRSWRDVVRAGSPRPVLDFLERHRVQQTIACARLTSEPLRFVSRELRRDHELRSYSLRRSGLDFCIHHGSQDLGVLDEVFRLRHYALPRKIDARLAALDRPPRVLDMGAHVGMFGLCVLERFPEASIVAFEPDPVNRHALECCVRANERDASWTVVAAAAANFDGEVSFAAGHSSGSQIEPGGGAGTVTVPAVDVLPRLADADLVKMDMEGGEWAVLGDARFDTVRPPVLALEYHSHLCPANDPHEHVDELLARAGYETQPIFREPSGVGMLWALAVS